MNKKKYFLRKILLLLIGCMIVNIATINLAPTFAKTRSSSRKTSSGSFSSKSSSKSFSSGKKVNSGSFSSPKSSSSKSSGKVNSGSFSRSSKNSGTGSNSSSGSSSSKKSSTYSPSYGGGYYPSSSLGRFFFRPRFGIPFFGGISPIFAIGVVLLIILLIWYIIWRRRL